MDSQPSEDFLLLAATLLSSLPSSPSQGVDNAVLLQLSALFGPMLTSALQLVDKGEVVRIRLPLGRELYQVDSLAPESTPSSCQVVSSSGMPYTLQPTLPPLLPPFDPVEAVEVKGESDADPPSNTAVAPEASTNGATHLKNGTVEQRELQWERTNLTRTRSLAKIMQRMYCPCAGFMYNALGGERNYLCKHLLAVIIAHQMEREVRTEVSLAGMIGLLGLNG